MKWYEFKKRMPILNSNILILRNGGVGIAVFDEEFAHFIEYFLENGACDANLPPLQVFFHHDEPRYTQLLAVECTHYWTYPSNFIEVE